MKQLVSALRGKEPHEEPAHSNCRAATRNILAQLALTAGQRAGYRSEGAAAPGSRALHAPRANSLAMEGTSDLDLPAAVWLTYSTK